MFFENTFDQYRDMKFSRQHAYDIAAMFLLEIGGIAHSDIELIEKLSFRCWEISVSLLAN